MASEDGGERSAARRLAALMFTDMAGYSALVQQDEPLAMALLDEHRRIVRKLLPGFGGREVETAGDSFLIEFGSALDALHCAIALQQQHAGRNAAAPAGRPIVIRVGLHVGDVEHRKGGKVFGDGVNLAARVEPLAPHGGISLSATFHDQVRRRLAAPFRSLGAQALKNIAEPMEVLVLDPPAIAALPPPRPRSALAALRFDWRWAAAAAVLAALAATVVAVRQAGPARDAKSVAVLPFANFSNDKENDYFAAGIHESILTHLARVKDLKVISRTSVTQYQGAARNLREIGAALGVANIVEGSVQRVGHRVRVQAQLIEVATDRHLWAESYDRDVADVFAIQSEVAQHIVAAIQGTLTPQEKQLIEQRPTASTEAYELYLRAEAASRDTNPSRESLYKIQVMLELAIASDPGFALAHARLAANHMRTYWWGFDASTQRREQALAAAETALRLQPDLAEGHFAMGMYHYFGFRDYERALEEFDKALSRAPNSVEALASTGFVQRRQGAWGAAMASLKRAAELDPNNANTVFYQGDTYWTVQEYANAAPYFEKARALAPGSLWETLWAAYFQILWKGDPEPLRQALAAVPAGEDPGGVVTAFRIGLAQYERRHEDAIALLEESRRDGFAPLQRSNFEVPKDVMLGQLHAAMGKSDSAREHFLRARDQLRDEIEAEPEGIFVAHAHAWLGLTLAYLGERDEALRNAARAVELLPISRDALDGPFLVQLSATTRLRLGDQDRALAELGKVLGMAGGPDAHLLRSDPGWQPLWNDQRFQRLIARSLPKRE
jgi:TolB-like protein/class 3 adenylate cyclase/Tfp pilus assembly protein PilF